MKRITLSDVDSATNTSGIPAMPDMYDTIKPCGDIISGSSDLLDDTLSDFIYKWYREEDDFPTYEDVVEEYDVYCSKDEYRNIVSELSNFYFNEIVMRITNNQAIEAIDTYVLGDNYSDEYKVVDIDGEEMDYFDDYDEAVEYAKENNGYQVLGSRVWYEYAITSGGDIESDILDIDDEIGKDWTNPNYIDED